MSRRSILFLTHRVPFPPDKGDKIRTFHQLDYLSSRHDVYCACFVDRPEDQAHAIALKRWCTDVVALPWNRKTAILSAGRKWFGGGTLTCGAYHDPRMFNLLASWGEAVNFDLVTAFSACMAPYALSVRAPRRVLDLCDADSSKWLDYADSGGLMGPVYRSEGRRLSGFEQACLRNFDATMVITARERAAIDPYQRNQNLFVVPNGVDLPHSTVPLASSRGPIITFVGRMDYRPNRDGILNFVQHCWPIVKDAVPKARLFIVGGDPVRRVRRLASASDIRVTGAVPDVRRFITASRVVIAPLGLVRGLPNKVLEAMAMHRPVVATPSVCRALGAQPRLIGKDETDRRPQNGVLLTANNAPGFAAKIVRLCRDDILCDELGESGCRFVTEHFNWDRILARYEQILLGDTSAQTPRLDSNFRSLRNTKKTQKFNPRAVVR